MKKETVSGKRRYRRRGHVDYFLLAMIMLLLVLGLLMLFEASSYMGQASHNDGYYYIKKQMQGVVLGLMTMGILSVLNYRIWQNRIGIILIYSFCIVLLALCFSPIGMNVNGARRWIQLGSAFQPSELSKFGILVVIAAILAQYPKGRIRDIRKGLLLPLCVILSQAILLYFQPNYSMLILTVVSGVAILVAAGMRPAHIVGLAILGGIIGLFFLLRESYRAARIDMFFDPFDDKSGAANQMQQAYYAIASGGFLGRGLGQSRQKFLFLPQRESDFIVAIIAEEFGIAGCVVLVALFFLLVWRGYRIASQCRNVYGSLLAIGITTMIGLQAMINIGVGLVALPTTGLTLPFFSLGSSSLTCTLAAMGLLLSISRDVNRQDVKRTSLAQTSRE